MTEQASSDTLPPVDLVHGEVVLCGSMSALAVMERLRDDLLSRGVMAIAPPPDDAFGPASTPEQITEAKRVASRRHMNLIKRPSTRAILVVNVDKGGKPNYIGPNTFGEIAVAFAEGRAIFLLHGMPHACEEELTAWGATCLYGDTAKLVAWLSTDDP